MKRLKLVLIIIFIILICFRIALPHYLLKYAVKEINKIPEYKVKIADLDVHLYRGAYSFTNIQLWKITKNIPVPFFEAKTVDFSIEWRALLHGKIVAKIIIQQPTINFVTDPNGKNEQMSISKQWLDVVKKLYPLNIDRLDLHDGKISLTSYKGNPPFKIYINNADFTIDNMQKAKDKTALLSSAFAFNGDAIGGGKINLQGKFDPFNKQPTFDMQAELKSLNISKIANFLKHYSAVDVSGGTFSLYGNAVAGNGKIKGVIKPFIKNLKIKEPKNANPLSALANSAAKLVAKIVENPKQKTIATQINISGDINDPDTSILSIIGYLLHHGFIHALLPQVDHSVKMEDVLFGKKVKKNSKFPYYKN